MSKSVRNIAKKRLRRYDWVIAFVLLVSWNVCATLIAQSHYRSDLNEIMQRESADSGKQVMDLSNSIERELSFIDGIPQMLAKSTRVRKAVAMFGPHPAYSMLSYDTRRNLWTANPTLKDLDKSLAEIEASLDVNLIFVTNAAGEVIAASDAGMSGSPVGVDASQREFFRKSMLGQQTTDYTAGRTTHIPGIYFTSPILIDGKFQGVVGAKVDVPALSYLVKQSNAVITDRHGVIILASDPSFEMHAFPGADVGRLSENENLVRYGRSELAPFNIEAWSPDDPVDLKRVQGGDEPSVVAGYGMVKYGLGVHVIDNLTAMEELLKERNWLAFLAGLAGSLAILIGNGLMIYLRSIRRANQLLEDQKNELDTLLHAANDGIHILDCEGNVFIANDSFCRMLGYARDEIVGMHVSRWDAKFSATQLNERIGKLLCDRGKIFETRHRRKDGSEFDVEISTVPVEIEGEMFLYNSARDITLRKQKEEELRLYESVYQHSSEGMVVTDADNKIITVNPAFTKVTGYGFDEVKGRDPKIFKSGRHDKKFYQAMWDDILTNGYWQGEIWDRKKNGQLHARFLTINTIKDQQGSIYRHVGLFVDITEKKQIDELLWKQANYDTLTGLPNRRLFRDRLDEECKKTFHSGKSLALLLIDLDQFKEVNDSFGQSAGDMLLKDAARRITSCVRDTDFVARLNGDEFTVILPEISRDSHGEDIVQQIVKVLAEPFRIGEELAYISASIGVSIYPNDAADTENLLKHADQAMHGAKDQGRNRFCYFTTTLQDKAQNRLRMIADMRSALATHQFQIHFQPIVELASGKVHKAEALIRWRHPVQGMVSPLVFIPLAEETGLINEIGDWVFDESAKWARRWSSMVEDFQVSINVSPLQLVKDDDPAWPNGFLNKYGLSGRNVVIEITEGLLINTSDNVANKLLQFRDAGMQVAIDDFGTGYSALSYLNKFDIDYLKIDKSFTDNLVKETQDRVLCEAIVMMAHKLGLKVIAEGVETEEQQGLLAKMNCDYVQGYLHSRPLPPEEFEVMLMVNRRVSLTELDTDCSK